MGCGSSKDNDFDVYYEVVDPPAASLDPKELMQLSIKRLLNRLKHFGCEPLEGDGDDIQALVDTVVLWNITTCFWRSAGEDRARSLRSVLNVNLSLEVLQRGLTITGVPKETWQGLRKQQLAELLYWKIAQDYLTKVCLGGLATGDFITNRVEKMLPALMGQWQATTKSGKLKHKEKKAKHEEKKEARKRDGPESFEAPPSGENIVPKSKMPQKAQAAELLSLPSHPQKAAPKLHITRRERDAAFDAFDAELGAFLDDMNVETPLPVART